MERIRPSSKTDPAVVPHSYAVRAVVGLVAVEVEDGPALESHP
jgi:hypothetical protein